jgi:hypothetical protein
MNQARMSLERNCPRCEDAVAPERFEGAEGITWLWRCACGWSSALAESGVVSRRSIRRAVGEVVAKG